MFRRSEYRLSKAFNSDKKKKRCAKYSHASRDAMIVLRASPAHNWTIGLNSWTRVTSGQAFFAISKMCSRCCCCLSLSPIAAMGNEAPSIVTTTKGRLRERGSVYGCALGVDLAAPTNRAFFTANRKGMRISERGFGYPPFPFLPFSAPSPFRVLFINFKKIGAKSASNFPFVGRRTLWSSCPFSLALSPT